MNTLQNLRAVIGSLTLLLTVVGMRDTALGQGESDRRPPLVIEAEMTPLLPEEGLQGWSMVSGDATIEYEDGELHGYGAGDRNAFLMSDRIWGDFVLEGEVSIEPGGNSGWQIRSRIDDPTDTKSRLRGYQIEIETTDRRWSGGIYEEGRRGWLDPLLNDEEARAAFKIGAWNRYRIEAEGIHLRSWVNGVPCGDLLDLAQLDGHLAFQIHSGTCDVRWRNLKILDRGRSHFVSSNAGFQETASEEKYHVDVRKFVPKVPTSTIRYTYASEGGATLEIMDQDGRLIGRLDLDEEESFRLGSGVPASFPEVAPGAGMKIRKDERHQLVIDLHQGRLTVIRDGVVLMKRYDSEVLHLGAVVMRFQDESQTVAEIDPVQCLVNEPFESENEE